MKTLVASKKVVYVVWYKQNTSSLLRSLESLSFWSYWCPGTFSSQTHTPYSIATWTPIPWSVRLWSKDFTETSTPGVEKEDWLAYCYCINWWIELLTFLNSCNWLSFGLQGTRVPRIFSVGVAYIQHSCLPRLMRKEKCDRQWCGVL